MGKGHIIKLTGSPYGILFVKKRNCLVHQGIFASLFFNNKICKHLYSQGPIWTSTQMFALYGVQTSWACGTTLKASSNGKNILIRPEVLPLSAMLAVLAESLLLLNSLTEPTYYSDYNIHRACTDVHTENKWSSLTFTNIFLRISPQGIFHKQELVNLVQTKLWFNFFQPNCFINFELSCACGYRTSHRLQPATMCFWAPLDFGSDLNSSVGLWF